MIPSKRVFEIVPLNELWGVERAEKSHGIGLGGAKEDATGSGCLFQAIVRMLEVDPCVRPGIKQISGVFCQDLLVTSPVHS